RDGRANERAVRPVLAGGQRRGGGRPGGALVDPGAEDGDLPGGQTRPAGWHALAVADAGHAVDERAFAAVAGEDAAVAAGGGGRCRAGRGGGRPFACPGRGSGGSGRRGWAGRHG